MGQNIIAQGNALGMSQSHDRAQDWACCGFSTVPWEIGFVLMTG